MNDPNWTAIPAKLHEAGYTVLYNRISWDPKNPVWRASAQRDGREWSSMGRDLETALVELEKRTQDKAKDRRPITPRERVGQAPMDSPAAS